MGNRRHSTTVMETFVSLVIFHSLDQPLSVAFASPDFMRLQNQEFSEP